MRIQFEEYGLMGIQPHHHLRSAAHGDLVVPRTTNITYGPCSFTVTGPSVWNSLPVTPRSRTNIACVS